MARRRMGLALGLMAAAMWVTAGLAQGQIAKVDLEKLGMPKETFDMYALMRCPNDLLTYRAVGWLDAGTVLVAYTVTPVCPATMAPAANAEMKLATFDTTGKMLHTADAHYVAGTNNVLPNGGVWTLANGRVVVEFPPSSWVKGVAAGGGLGVWSAELRLVQTVELQGMTAEALHAAGVTADDLKMVLWRGMNEQTDAQCVELSGNPLAETGTCAAAELNAVTARAHEADGYAVPKGEEVMMSTGASRDGSRASAFLTKEETTECRMEGKYCPTSGEFVVFDMKSKQTLLKEKVSVLGRMALAPDGKHAAVMDKGKLEIVAVP